MAETSHRSGIYRKTVASAENLDMLKQINKGKRNRKYAYQVYIDILSEGTELSGVWNVSVLG